MINGNIPEVQKFTRDTLWTFLGLGLQAVVGLVTVALLTKSFSAELYGIWAQISVTKGLIAPLLVLGLGTAYIRFMPGEENTEKIKQALGTVIWPVITIGCLALTLSWLLRNSLSVVMFVNPEYVTLVSLTFLWIFVQAIFVESLCYYKALRRIRRVAVMQMICAVLQTVTLAILLINGFGFIWVVLSNVVIQGLFAVLTFVLIILEIGLPTMNFSRLKEYLPFGIPILPSLLLLWIVNSSARYFITHLLGISYAGIYSVSWSFANLCSFFITPIAVNVFYTISGLWEKGEVEKVRSYLKYSTKLFLSLTIPSVVGMSMFSQQLLKIFTTSEFLTSEALVLLLGIGIIFSGVYQINSYTILLIKQTKWIPFIIATASIISVGLNLLLIPQIGILGAAVSSVVSYFALAAIATIWARRAIGYSVDYKFLAKVITGSLLMALCLYFIRINGVFGIVLTVTAGAAIFSTALFLMRAFSTRERQIIRETISGLVPRLK
jgi:O-antigen/teichoic acid export membrane protein